jgi:hypothetical protein
MPQPQEPVTEPQNHGFGRWRLVSENIILHGLQWRLFWLWVWEPKAL